VKSWFGRTYGEHTEEYSQFFDKTTSSQAWEEYVELTGFGLAPVKRENVAFSIDSETQGYLSRVTNVAYALGFIVTHEELEDNLYEVVSKRRAKALAFSMRQTKEIVHANMFNFGFTATVVGDGAFWFSIAHPCINGNQANMPTAGSDLSESAIEDMLTMIMLAKNSKGLAINLMPRSLCVHPSLWWDAQRLIKSALQADSNLNAINVIAATKAIPEGVKMNHYFSAPSAWFVRTNVPDGNITQERQAAYIAMDNDFATMNAYTRGYERYSPGIGDWRGTFGNAGP